MIQHDQMNKQLQTKWAKLQHEGGTLRCTRTGKVYKIVPERGPIRRRVASALARYDWR